jgi:AraC-like DNA-binding protein
VVVREARRSGGVDKCRGGYRAVVLNFSALLDATRHNAAKHYLEETDMRLYMAGYTEPAALVRAFKRWTGATPMKFRDATGRSTRPTF